ncbi:MAG: amidohydrolase family protein [Bacteroidota bacterium]
MMRLFPLLTGFFFLLACQPSGTLYKDAICIEHISTIDPTQGLQADQTVILKNGKIHAIGSSSDIVLSPDNTIIDGTGKYLIPGLWDAHVHFAYMEELASRMFDLFLLHGITSVRDTGGEIDFVKKWKDKALANPTEAPRVMIAGPLLDGIPNVYDGSDPGHPPLSVGLKSVEEVAAEVEELDRVGVDLLKAYEMLTPEQFATITRLGKAKGLKVTGHVPLSMDVISASNAGLNSMEHMRNLELSCATNSDELLKRRQTLLFEGKGDPGAILRSRIHQAQRQIAVENYSEEKAEEVLSVLRENETWQIPTLALNTGFVKKPFAKPEFQTSFAYLPDSTELKWKENIKAFGERAVSPFRKAYADWTFAMVGKIHESGIDIMAGTDCPIFFLTPGRSLHEELAVLVQAGLTPLEAIKAATLNPARYFGMETELGSIQTGMWADLVILNSNPLEAIENTTDIEAVVKQGAYYDRQKLEEIRARLDQDNSY